MRKLFVVPVLALVAALCLGTSPAYANGGTYPSNAPMVASGATVTGGATTITGYGPNVGGKTGNEFYRVALGFSDHLIIDFTNITGYGTGVCVFDPGVTDFTLTDADCLEDVHTSSATNKAQLQYVAPTAGTYLLAVHTSDSGQSWAYQATVNVLHASTVSATGPTSVKVGHKIRVKGQASAAGIVVLQLKAGGWKTVGQAHTKSDGSFKIKYKATHTGRYKFRVLFGSSGYIGSKSSKVKVQVHR